MAIDLLVTDKNLVIQGDPLSGWTDLSCTLKFNEPAAGSVTVPAHDEFVAELQSGRRLVVMRDEEIWCAGPIEEPQEGEWSVDGQAAPGQVQIRFSDDLARVAGYVTYPAPGSAFASQVTATDNVRTFTATNAEAIIRTLVSENCGPTALAARRIEQFGLGALASVGSATSITTRFEALLDVCRTVASGDGLGFRTVQDGDDILFEVYEPTDRSATARFSTELGNLRMIRYKISAPVATSELVIGGDTGSRAYVEVTSGAATPWWRAEKVIDQTGTTNANGELTQAGNAGLAEDGPTVSLETVTVDTEDLKAGRDYTLGDRVSVILPTGVEVEDIVRAITLTATPDGGEQVTTQVGTPDATTNRRMVRQIHEHARRLGRIETRR